MDAIEELGITRELFSELYDSENGFDYHNENTPSRDDNVDFYGFLRDGAENLVEENGDIMAYIIDEAQRRAIIYPLQTHLPSNEGKNTF